MRWIQSGAPWARTVRPKTKLQWEEWVTDVDQPCARCKALDAGAHWARYIKGRGPQPVKDTHPGCRCRRVPITGCFGASPVQCRAKVAERVVLNPLGLGSLRQAGFIVRSCKNCE